MFLLDIVYKLLKSFFSIVLFMILAFLVLGQEPSVKQESRQYYLTWYDKNFKYILLGLTVFVFIAAIILN